MLLWLHRYGIWSHATQTSGQAHKTKKTKSSVNGIFSKGKMYYCLLRTITLFLIVMV